MYNRKNLDVGAYLVVGPENTNGRAVEEIVGDAVRAGFTIVQPRRKSRILESRIQFRLSLTTGSMSFLRQGSAESKLTEFTSGRATFLSMFAGSILAKIRLSGFLL